MAGGFDWLGKLVWATDASLAKSNRRTATGHYGLVGFVDGAQAVSLDGALLATAQAADERIRELRVGGHGAEDGYQALRLTLERHEREPEESLSVLLVTDEDRDILIKYFRLP